MKRAEILESKKLNRETERRRQEAHRGGNGKERQKRKEEKRKKKRGEKKRRREKEKRELQLEKYINRFPFVFLKVKCRANSMRHLNLQKGSEYS